MKIVIFEDKRYNNFYPLSLTRPVWDLRMGCMSLLERLNAFFLKNKIISGKDDIYLFAREYFKPLYGENTGKDLNDLSVLRQGEDILFVNALALPSHLMLNLEKNKIYIKDDVPLALLAEKNSLDAGGINDFPSLQDFLLSLGFPLIESSEIDGLDYIWDFVARNPEMVKDDINSMGIKTNPKVNKSVTFIGDGNLLYIEDNVRIDPFVCFDLTSGPVLVKRGTVIDSFSRIEGPCYIGEDCRILGARLRGGCSIGRCSRIGGEVEESIFHAHSNKYHDGFIGHSYIGEWVNLGAMTTNSDLKNNYTQVKVYVPGIRVNTGSIKIGCFMGDFTKTSIGTLINTGTSIGPGCMVIHSGGLTPPHIPAFAWYMNNRFISPAGLDHFLDTCKRVTERRGVEFSENYAGLLEHIFEITETERETEIKKWKRILK